MPKFRGPKQDTQISRSQTRFINTEVPKSSVRLLMTLGSETRVRKNWKHLFAYERTCHRRVKVK